MNFDWKTWCRFCGKAGNNVKFESTIDIEFYFEISDQHPKICQQCSVFLKEFERFLHKTEQSNVFFKELANQKNVDSSKINKIREIFGLDLMEINLKSSENYTTVLPDLKINAESSANYTTVPPDLKIIVEASASGSCTVTLPELNIKDEVDVPDLPESQRTQQIETNNLADGSTDDKKLQTDNLLAEPKKKKKNKDENDTSKQIAKESRRTANEIMNITNCHICEAHCPTMKALVDHCETQHNCRPQVHCICGHLLETYGAYTRHRRKCYVALIAPYKCDLCSESYAHRSLIQKHMIKTHIAETAVKIICETCGKEFKKPYFLKLHKKFHLPAEEREIFACTQCDKKFTSKFPLKYHIRRVHDKIEERNFACHICAKTFVTKNILDNHIESHNTTLDHKCKICSRKFKSKTLLKFHQACHQQEKTHFCEICNRGFTRVTGKNNHMLIHTDERPFACPESNCELTFKRKGELNVHHNRVHLGKQRYICKVCGKDFYYTKDRFQHMKQSHPVEFVEFEEKWKLIRKKVR